MKMQSHEPLFTDPHHWFAAWWQEALSLPVRFPNAVVLATAGADGAPSSRVVLIKDFSSNGFNFFTNYESEKAQDLQENSRAALTFYWDSLGRQARVNGRVEKVSRKDSEAYFASRPRGSQLGAWASAQSQAIASRDELLKRRDAADQKYPNSVPCPESWGGFLLRPSVFEFWILQEDRLHDRFRFDREKNLWKISRLAP